MKIIPIKFDDEMVAKLERIAKELKLPLSTAIRFLLNGILKERENNEKKEKKGDL
jgi:antitoxin component of RelBE/YafQ-DinJ toxin-antitoxin module